MKQIKYLKSILLSVIITLASYVISFAQISNSSIKEILPEVLKAHKEFVSIPCVSTNKEDMLKNLQWLKTKFEELNFSVKQLESPTLPVFLAEKNISKEAKTVLFYFHTDGQAINPASWNQEHPFKPVLKERDENNNWNIIEWSNLDNNKIDPEWRIFGRAAADDKAPITMMLSALKLLNNQKLNYNIKVLIDSEEESQSQGLNATLKKYKNEYASDYMIIMDGPAHPTNKPTMAYGFRGNAKCSITIYGSKLPQHSGHYGNYAPNPIFTLAHLLASMKDEAGRVTIAGFYDGISITEEIKEVLRMVPDDENEIKKGLVINTPDNVGDNYQESLQYPSLNIRHIDTSWKGPGLKTIIPELVSVYMDVRLVAETDGARQLEKIRQHIRSQNFLVLDREPTDEERLHNPKIAKFIGDPGENAYRLDINASIAKQLRAVIETEFGESPVNIRTLGGSVPIKSFIDELSIPTIIIPMVNMDNNQHNPNENIRIGNIIDGIRLCMTILKMKLE